MKVEEPPRADLVEQREAHREVTAQRLADVRRRTLELVAVLDSATLRRQHIPILSPMVWDVGHIGSFEEQWIGQRLAGLPPLAAGYERMFDPVANPRPTRAALPLPTGEELAGYLARVREQTLHVLASGADGGDRRLLAGGFVYEMVAEHEEQHQETLLQAMQVLADPPYAPRRRRPLPSPGALARIIRSDAARDLVHVPAGPFVMGWQRPGFAYDNELPPHEVEVAAFAIGRFPVTHGDYLAFVQDGGYRRRELWQPAGWAFRERESLAAPGHWVSARSVGRIGSPFQQAWLARFMDVVAPVEEVADLPILHVCYWEADAYARWAGKRLPTEAEWEKAALWDPAAGRARPWPWGDEPPGAPAAGSLDAHANLDQLGFAPAPIGAYPRGRSAYGIEQLVGDCWEWTSSDFGGYPGFVAYPYADYSQTWFGSDYKVLRGASWATRPAVARGTFRNWDYPIRRQIFAGFRLAQDA
jgi:iron(II)-dependent oxidoreductase